MGVSKLKLPSYLWLVLAPVGLSFGSAFCLAFLLDFDRDLSPAWHLALYGLMSFSLLAAVSALGFHPSFAWTGWLRYLLPVFPLLVLAGMFAFIQFRDGSVPAGLRDVRLHEAVVTSVAFGLWLCAAFGILRATVMLVVIVGVRLSAGWVSNVPLASRMFPECWLDDAGRSAQPPSDR